MVFTRNKLIKYSIADNIKKIIIIITYQSSHSFEKLKQKIEQVGNIKQEIVGI